MISALVTGAAIAYRPTPEGGAGRLLLADGNVVDWRSKRQRVLAVMEATANRTPACLVGELIRTDRGYELIAERALALAVDMAPADGAAAPSLPRPRSRLLAPLRWLATYFPQSISWGGRLRTLLSPARKPIE